MGVNWKGRVGRVDLLILRDYALHFLVEKLVSKVS